MTTNVKMIDLIFRRDEKVKNYDPSHSHSGHRKFKTSYISVTQEVKDRFLIIYIRDTGIKKWSNPFHT